MEQDITTPGKKIWQILLNGELHKPRETKLYKRIQRSQKSYPDLLMIFLPCIYSHSTKMGKPKRVK
jgi:hypothetical protein